MIMKKKLSFKKALELLSGWNPVCYSCLSTRNSIVELPMLSSVDIQNLSSYSGWYVSCGFYSVQLVIKKA